MTLEAQIAYLRRSLELLGESLITIQPNQKLLRIGSLVGDVWKSTTPRKPCTFVHAHSRFTNEESTIERKISMSPVQACGGNDVSPSCCDNDLILVDTFEDKSRIANSITL